MLYLSDVTRNTGKHLSFTPRAITLHKKLSWYIAADTDESSVRNAFRRISMLFITSFGCIKKCLASTNSSDITMLQLYLSLKSTLAKATNFSRKNKMTLRIIGIQNKHHKQVVKILMIGNFSLLSPKFYKIYKRYYRAYANKTPSSYGTKRHPKNYLSPESNNI